MIHCPVIFSLFPFSLLLFFGACLSHAKKEDHVSTDFEVTWSSPVKRKQRVFPFECLSATNSLTYCFSWTFISSHSSLRYLWKSISEQSSFFCNSILISFPSWNSLCNTLSFFFSPSILFTWLIDRRNNVQTCIWPSSNFDFRLRHQYHSHSKLYSLLSFRVIQKHEHHSFLCSSFSVQFSSKFSMNLNVNCGWRDKQGDISLWIFDEKNVLQQTH